MMLIVCPNLAEDVTLELDAFVAGKVHRSRPARRQAGGKGVNLARAWQRFPGESPPSCLLGFAGGATGARIANGLRSEEIPTELLPFQGESRCCTIIVPADGSPTTVINETGPWLEDASPLMEGFLRRLPGARAVAFMGSLPPGLPADTYAKMILICRDRGISTVLDTSGEALRCGITAGPTFVTPNRDEAASLLGEGIDTPEEEVAAARRLRAMGSDHAVITLASRGVVLASQGRAGRCYVPAPSWKRPNELTNPIGAGDTFDAGLLRAHLHGASPQTATELGVRSATASLREGFGRIDRKTLETLAVAWQWVK